MVYSSPVFSIMWSKQQQISKTLLQSVANICETNAK